MHPTEMIVRRFHESWDMRDPERGAAVMVVEGRETTTMQRLSRVNLDWWINTTKTDCEHLPFAVDGRLVRNSAARNFLLNVRCW